MSSELAGSGAGLLIGEFARRCRLPVSTLRYYDEIGLLRPAVVDPASGYRRYHSDQLVQAVLIGRLRTLGVPPAAMTRIVAGGPAGRRALEAERRRLHRELDARRRALDVVDRLLAGSHDISPASVGGIVETELAHDRVALMPIRGAVPNLGSLIARAAAQLRRCLRGADLPWRLPFGALLPLDLRDDTIEATVFVRLTGPVQPADRPVTAGRLPAGRVTVAVHHGPYDTLALTYDALFDRVLGSGHRATGPVIEEYLSLGNPNRDPGHPRTRLSVPMGTE